MSAVVIRRYLRRVDPYAIAGFSLMIGAVVVVAITLLAADLPTASDLNAEAVLAVITLALFNTVLAYFLFYHLITDWGATRTTLVTYVMPPLGVTLGALFLDETVDWKIVLGAALILGGILAVNWRRHLRPAPAAASTPSRASGD
jgi:drug/metabolite transporter (DMT)-like permease